MKKPITIDQYHRSRGLTLVELMIASTLGLFVVGVIITLFISSGSALNQTTRLGAVNENGRYAISVLTEELRLVDFLGQAHAATVTNDPDLTGIASDCDGNAGGYDYVNSLWVTTADNATVAACITDAVVNSDVIFIKHAAARPTALDEIETDKNYVLTNDALGRLFNQADLTIPSADIGGEIPGGNAWEYIASAYYIRAGDPPTLYRKRLNGNVWENPGQEVAMGVERMHLQFGIDNNNDAVADFFVSNTGVADWNTVVSIRIFILVRSESSDFSYTDEKTYQLGNAAFGGVSYTPNDNYYRRLFETSVMLRNRRLIITGGF